MLRLITLNVTLSMEVDMIELRYAVAGVPWCPFFTNLSHLDKSRISKVPWDHSFSPGIIQQMILFYIPTVVPYLVCKVDVKMTYIMLYRSFRLQYDYRCAFVIS